MSEKLQNKCTKCILSCSLRGFNAFSCSLFICCVIILYSFVVSIYWPQYEYKKKKRNEKLWYLACAMAIAVLRESKNVDHRCQRNDSGTHDDNAFLFYRLSKGLRKVTTQKPDLHNLVITLQRRYVVDCARIQKKKEKQMKKIWPLTLLTWYF